MEECVKKVKDKGFVVFSSCSDTCPDFEFCVKKEKKTKTNK